MTTAQGSNDMAVLHLRGDVDALSQAEYRRVAEDLIAASPARLVVDMSELSSIDSSGLGLLVHLQSLTKDNNALMLLKHVPPRAAALLKRTGLDRVFQIDPA